jgi:hypothetical protein
LYPPEAGLTRSAGRTGLATSASAVNRRRRTSIENNNKEEETSMSHKLELFHNCARTSIRLTMMLAALSGIARAQWPPVPLPGCGSLNSYIDVWQIKIDGNPLCFVGQPPTGAAGSTINLTLAPVTVKLLDGAGNVVHVLDPTAPLAVPVNTKSNFAALDALLESPILNNWAWSYGSTSLGTVQWGEATERASFWNLTGKDLKDWHVVMSLASTATLPPLKVKHEYWAAPDTANPSAYQVEKSVLDDYLLTQAQSLPTATVLFYTYNIQRKDGTSCCTRGFHTNYVDTAGYTVPYMWATYIDGPAGNPDLNSASHEVAEFMHNPLGTNAVAGWPAPHSFSLPWNPPYYFLSCSFGLEVGDPIEDRPAGIRLFTIAHPTMTYHFQNVITAPWLIPGGPPFSVNGAYTFPNPVDGEFNTRAFTCPSTLSTLPYTPVH